jgi:hypothetical protein
MDRKALGNRSKKHATYSDADNLLFFLLPLAKLSHCTLELWSVVPCANNCLNRQNSKMKQRPSIKEGANSRHYQEYKVNQAIEVGLNYFE